MKFHELDHCLVEMLLLFVRMCMSNNADLPTRTLVTGELDI